MSTPAERLARVDDYTSGHMEDAEASGFEEELFAAAAAGQADDAVSFADEVARSTKHVLDRGAGFADGSTRAQVDAILASGRAVHYVDLGSGGPVEVPMWSKDRELILFRLGVDARGFDHVNVRIETPAGAHIKTFRDVHCDPVEGAIYAVCEEPLARLSYGAGRVISRITGVPRGLGEEEPRREIAVFDTNPV